MRTSPLRAFFLLLAALAACQPYAAVQTPPEPSGTGPLVSSLQVEPAADSVRFVLRVTNAGSAPVELHFVSGQTHDFLVRDGERELWRWSAGMGFIQALRSETLAPGETRDFAESWRPDASARGRALVAVGRLASRSHPLERTVEFRVP